MARKLFITIYNDSSIDDELGKYFDSNGVKNVEKKGIDKL